VIEYDKHNSRNSNQILLNDKDQQILIVSCASGKSQLSMIALFLVCECNCGHVQDGKTALYWAVDKGLFHVTKVLLDASANTEIANKVTY